MIPDYLFSFLLATIILIPCISFSYNAFLVNINLL